MTLSPRRSDAQPLLVAVSDLLPRHRAPLQLHDPRARQTATTIIKGQLRAPMAALQALSNTLDSDEGLSPELAERMRQHSRILARSVALLIEDLVFVHTWMHRSATLAPEDVVLSEQVERVAAIFPDLAVHVAPMPDARVHADPLRLQQLLANLIRGSHDDRPLRFDLSVEADTATLRLTGGHPVGGHELEIARLLARAHGGRLHQGHHRRPSVRLTLPLARGRQGA